VHTLKLEGRGRSPEYISTVTAAYRNGVDAIQAKTFNPELVAQLNHDLKKVYHRGHSSGYYLGRDQGWSATHGSKASRQKVQAGRVTHYYNKLGVAEITASAPIAAGQEYLIIGDTTGVVKGTLEELRLDDSTTVGNVSNGQVFSIKVDAKVRQNDKLFLHLPA
jgi:putative protease